MTVKKEEKDLKILSFMPFFSPFRVRTIGVFEICESLDQKIKSLLCITFRIRLDYMLGMVLCRY